MTTVPSPGLPEVVRDVEPSETETFRAIARPRRGFLFFLIFAAIGSAAVQMSTVLLTLSLKANALSPTDATSILSLATGVSGVVALVGLPIVGRLSDRTRSRFGRRRPYLLAAAIILPLGSLVLLFAADAWTLAVANLLITTGSICVGVTTYALVAEQLPNDRRGPASALLNLATPIGALIGIGISQPFGGNLTAMALLPAVLAVVSVVLFVVVLRDPQVVHTKAPAGRLLDLIGIFWVNPFRFPDFFFVFTSRMLVFCGVAAINSFQAIFLLAHLGYQPQDLGSAILLTVVINAAITLLVAPTVGKISDRIGRRKPFVFIAALILAAGLVMAAVSETFGAYLVAVAVIAVGQGVYFSVELALATQVLPDPENPAKDLALINVANNLPVSLVAVLAPMILSFGVGSNEPRNFSALFIAGALAVVVGGILITFIRKAK